MIIDVPSTRDLRLKRLSEHFVELTHRLVSESTFRVERGQLVIQGNTGSYHAVQLALAAVKALMLQGQVTLPVRLLLRVNERLLALTIANSTRTRRSRQGSETV